MIARLERLIFGRDRSDDSSSLARQRLKLVLEYDRAQLPPGILEEIKDEIVRIISRHASVDPAGVQVALRSGGRLILEVPLQADQLRGRAPLATGDVRQS